MRMRSPATRSAPLLPAGSPGIEGIVNILSLSWSSSPRTGVPAPGGIAAPADRHARRAGGRVRYPGGDRDTRELKDAFGVPVLVSPSRKSFLRVLTGRDVTRSGPATLAAEIFAAWQGADYIRTHDVAAARDALTVLASITSEVGHA